jgi:hypothetical protein
LIVARGAHVIPPQLVATAGVGRDAPVAEESVHVLALCSGIDHRVDALSLEWGAGDAEESIHAAGGEEKFDEGIDRSHCDLVVKTDARNEWRYELTSEWQTCRNAKARRRGVKSEQKRGDAAPARTQQLLSRSSEKLLIESTLFHLHEP